MVGPSRGPYGPGPAGPGTHYRPMFRFVLPAALLGLFVTEAVHAQGAVDHAAHSVELSVTEWSAVAVRGTSMGPRAGSASLAYGTNSTADHDVVVLVEGAASGDVLSITAGVPVPRSVRGAIGTSGGRAVVDAASMRTTLVARLRQAIGECDVAFELSPSSPSDLRSLRMTYVITGT